MDNPSVSIIVTVYNKQENINKCLLSILNQSYKNINVLVIDDGSTDKSAEIIKSICKQDARFNYYYQKNKGVSSARNYGLSKAQGKYVLFIDGDDFVDSNYVETFLKYKDFDLVVGGYRRIEEGKNNIEIKPSQQVVPYKNFENKFFNKESFEYIGLPISKLFNLEIIKEHNLKFDENIDLGEDTIFDFNYMKYVSKVKLISYSGYNNLILPGTLSRKPRKNLWQLNVYLIDSLNKIFNFKYDEYWQFMYIRAITIEMSSMSRKYKDFKNAIRLIRKNPDFKQVKYQGINGTKDKINYLILKFNAISIGYVMYAMKHIIKG